MTTILLQRLRTPNDKNGNPRRVWLAYTPNGHTVGAWREGYEGTALLRELDNLDGVTVNRLPTLKVPVNAYNQHVTGEGAPHGGTLDMRTERAAKVLAQRAADALEA